MAKKKDSRASIKLSSSNTLWLERLAHESAMRINIHDLVNEAVARSRVWLETNTPRKAKS